MCGRTKIGVDSSDEVELFAPMWLQKDPVDLLEVNRARAISHSLGIDRDHW